MTYRIGVLVVDGSTDRKGLVLEDRDPLVTIREVPGGHVWTAQSEKVRLATPAERAAARKESSQ
ncbi:hypothetical protein AB0A70_27675 [Streptomyces morookaense]|uniref:hypothetical protein n=1 Tax=Streptomyces morookaense TaxID=1970 RepID=UPI0033FDE450